MEIALVGDVMLGRLVNEVLRDKNSLYPWGNTLSLFQRADLRICNLECVISNLGKRWSKTPKIFHFRTDEKNIDTLSAARIDIVSLANNHVLDYEEEALLRMLDVLNLNNISYAGAGKNIEKASQACVRKCKGKSIGFIAFTDNEPEWEAARQKSGVYYVPIDINDPRAELLFEKVQILKKTVEFAIVSAHWGPNWGYAPPQEQIEFAHVLIEAGADLIFGHSGHVFRGIEIYQEKPIIYCAGDFIDDYAIDEIERNDESFVFSLQIEEKLKLLLYPTIISNFQAHLASPSERGNKIMSKMKDLCEEFGTRVDSFNDHLEITV